MWTDVTLGRNGRERQRNTATCDSRQILNASEWGSGASGKRREEGEWGRGRMRKESQERDSLILERAQRHIPQFSDSKSWLTVSEVEPVRQLATRIWIQESPPSFSGLVLQDLPNNSSEGWSNSDAAVYGCRSMARTNNTWRTWWRPHFLKQARL